LASPDNNYDAANKIYVDQVALGLAWQEPVLDIVTFANLPPTPDVGDRYILSDGDDTNDIAVWQSPGQWYYYAPATGWAAWVTDDAILPTNDQGYFVYNGALESSFKWVSIGTTITHNNLAGLQGGATSQYYHLDLNTYNTVATTGDIPTLTSELVNDSGFVTAYTEGYGIDVTEQVISVDTNSVASHDWVTAQGYLTSVSHNDTTSIQGGAPGQYYHLDSDTFNTVATTGDIPIYTGGTGIDIAGTVISADPTEVAVLPAVWESGKYLKATAVEGTLEWATAGGTGGGIEDVPDDGNLYVREYENWVKLGTLVYSTDDDDVTLPASPNVGDSFEMVGTGTAWTVHANTGQYIRLDETESVVTGVATSSTGFGCASFIYIGAVADNNTWLIRSAAGVIGVT
jgi:hypothetical protein